MRDTSGCISEQNSQIVLNNKRIEVCIDKDTGFISSIKNISTDTSFKSADGGSWPFEIKYGENNQRSSLTKNTKTRASSFKAWYNNENSYLDVSYQDLKLDWNGGTTGIKAIVHYVLPSDAEYFKVNVNFDLTKADGDLDNITFFSGGSLSAGDNQRLTAPTWGGGTYWEDPVSNRDFISGVTLGYPGKDNRSMECGWIDLHNNNAGIGIALVNKKQTATEFRISSDTGLNISCVMLEPKTILGQSVPVKKDELFTTDEMIVAPHSGDWHTMADIYRSEYEKAFINADGTPDYLTWDDISKKVKNTDYMIRYFAGLDGELVTTFSDMYTQTVNQIKAMNADPRNCMVWIAGQNKQGYAFDVPMMLPSFPPSGGDTGLKELDDKLHALGASVFHYEHPFAVDPASEGYFESTDPLQHTEYWNMCTHHSVCVDNKTMQDLWKSRIIPDIKSLGADGVQFDQAPLQQTVCNLSGHYHSDNPVSRLSSHAAGIKQLETMVRSDLAQDAYIVSEAASDILCRYVDVRQACWHVQPLWNGCYEFCASQYTFPQYVVQSTSIYIDKNGVTQNAMLLGAITGGIECLSDGAAQEIRNEFIRFRREIRSAAAPGFPYGFRDNLGVTTNDTHLVAKAFTDGKKVTVTYLSNIRPVKDGVIKVDMDKLGYKGKGVKEISLEHLKANTCGFIVIDP